ncbi:MAG: hypothetical protein K8R21_00945 [Leptospira sp.]|nr:hypothetical protein [Leptospira sp.]
MNLNDLNTIKTTEDSWRDFVLYSISSDFFKEVRGRTSTIEEAISLTLFNNYLNTFPKEEQERLLNDKAAFMVYAKGFVEILSEYRFSKKSYDKSTRAGFLGMIKNLLREQKDSSGKMKDEVKYTFYHSIVQFCSSLEFIELVYERYRAYIFQAQSI